MAKADSTYLSSMKKRTERLIGIMLNYSPTVIWNRETLADGLLFLEEFTNIYNVINGLFPTTFGFSPNTATAENFVKFSYIQFLQKDKTTMLDGIVTCRIPELYYSEFLSQLTDTDFRLADATPYDNTAWHVRAGDSVAALNMTGRYERQIDLSGTTTSDVANQFAGSRLGDAMQKIVGSTERAFWATSDFNGGTGALRVYRNGQYFTSGGVTFGVYGDLITFDSSLDPTVRISNENRPKTVIVIKLERYKITNC